jgi:Zn-dependent protease with chaperone function
MDATLLAARTFLSAAYSRDTEAAADAFGMTVLHCLGRHMRRIAEPGEEDISVTLDHPLTPERVSRLEHEDAAPTAPILLNATE